MMRKKFLRIGLTGGIASGKSTVGKMLAQMGAVIVDTDKIAREVVAPGSEALGSIRSRFGAEVLDEAGSLRRDVLGKLVFSDVSAREWLERLLHPLIRNRAEELAQAAEADGAPAVIFDVPLLFETGWDKNVDQVWTVYIEPETQRKRLAGRDGLNEREISARIASQLPIGEKADRSAVVINNEGSLSDTLRQVESAWRKVLRDMQSRSGGGSF